MIMIRKSLIIVLLSIFLAGMPALLFAQSPQENDRQAVVALLKEQNRQLSGDLRHIRREIAALRAQLEEPGLRDIFAGIGYIFGLFGVAAFVAARRKE
ncbi:MAG: hypothetical protein K9J79_04945 [Desulfobacteraceae bacterium]|nr:hypothetical protein [Desulfobacteraceae bacterium]MCF8094690.1 hypothetical protein [Desulfobacteraceae bacterium]